MKGGKTPLGYTIVEVMIVLAVSGVMFLVAANFINGKEARASFNQGTNEFVSRLQSLAQDVIDGQYSDVPITCTTGGGSLSFGVAGQQGRNQDCIFLGKDIHFYNNGSGQRADYETFSIAGARTISGSLPNAQVHAIPGLTTQQVIPKNLFLPNIAGVQSMRVIDTSGVAHNGVFNIGFAQGLGVVSNPALGVYKSGAQTVGLIYVDRTSPSTSTWANATESNVAGMIVKPAQSATICLTDGQRYARVFIGGAVAGGGPNSNNNNQLSVSLQHSGATVCP